MNHREPPHLPVGARRALRCLSLLLLPVLAPKAAHSVPRTRPAPGAVPPPYLPELGALPLRFAPATPPPDLTTKPAAAAPPVPALNQAENSVAQANAAATQSASIAARAADEAPVVEVKPKETPPPAKPPPPAIIPDDTRPSVRPEDFLPFFQVPGGAKKPGDVNVIVPASVVAPAPTSPIPPSTATYTQTPK